jgi:hypothetical protein
MRLRRMRSRRPAEATEMTVRRPNDSNARVPETLVEPVVAVVADVVAIVREVLVWPGRLWLGAAEVAGAFVLSAWEAVALPLVELGVASLRAALRFAERQVTPARGLTVVALAATIALGASQFSDYRAVEVGAPSYQSVENVAPAPQVDPQSPRSAHGATVFAIAVAGLFVTAFAVGRNWRLARLLTLLGMAALLISLLVDAPHGLREGSAAVDYEGAEAVLLGGFWAQLWSAVTLAVVGPLLAAQLRAGHAARRAHRVPGLEGPCVTSGFPAHRRGSGMEGAAT